jgi:deoxycytidine triphosphate deaminase/cell division protein FtsB
LVNWTNVQQQNPDSWQETKAGNSGGTMVLPNSEIDELIRSHNLLETCDRTNIRNSSYILRAGSAFQPETGQEKLLDQVTGLKKAHVWEIGPSETLIVKTKEKVRMPPMLCATYAPLYRLSSQGVMLLNASIVEPGYVGHLSCFLVNFSSQSISFREGDPIAKIIFHVVAPAPTDMQEEVIADRLYDANLSVSAKKFHKSFLDITGIEERAAAKAKEEVKTWVRWGGGVIVLLLAWASLEPFFAKWIWEKTGLTSVTQRVADVELLKKLEANELKLAIEALKKENEAMKKEIENMKNGK